MTAYKHIKWFKEIRKSDLNEVGGKGANLGEMTSFSIPVPDGFVVTSPAYFYFLKENNFVEQLKPILNSVNQDDPSSFAVASSKCKKIIISGKIPKDLALEVMKAYVELSGNLKNIYVAIRSSATAEDLPTASFAGQQATYLNIFGEVNVLKKVHDCWASLFEPRAIFYRLQNKFDHFRVGIAVPVQKMIQSDTSGVMFTTDPVTQEKNRIIIEAIYGLGEMIVQGQATPDRYVVDKNNLEILKKDIFSQPIQLSKKGEKTFQNKVAKSIQDKQKITDKQIKEIARIGKVIQDHYFFPQDVEWAIEKNKIYIVQTRPITTLSDKKEQEEPKNERSLIKSLLLTGMPASPGIATGKVIKIFSPKEINKVKNGDILVTTMTTPDFVPAMKKVAGIITDKGGQTSHAAIVSRELGVPCIVGTAKATKIFKNGQYLGLNGKTGEIYIPLPIDKKVTLVSAFSDTVNHTSNLSSGVFHSLKTATKLYVNLAEPELAKSIATKNIDGVGLARAEFMIAQLGIHPKKLIEQKKEKLFINHIADGLEVFCKEFYPRSVVYRATDFKTNEYQSLNGGKVFEPQESNPMLGYRGAYRYINDSAVFDLELEAIKKVRSKYKNLNLMIPFVHVPWEISQIKKIIAAKGLIRSSSFKLWMMAEIPSNVIMLEDFLAQGIDGVSIGSNDLTMLILGIDRDNDEVAPLFSEKDPAVLWALEKIIRTCHKYKVTCSICGQAPSVYPELVDKLVEWGITSISVNPDVIESVRQTIYESEQKLLKSK